MKIIGGGAARAPEWVQLRGPVTIEGTSPHDPSGLTGVGTSYNSDTGVFTIQPSAVVAFVLGYRSAMARWSFRVTSLYPAWNPDTEAVDAYIDLISAPATSRRYGVGLGMLNAPASGYAAASGFFTSFGSVNLASWYSYRPAATGGNLFQLLGATRPKKLRMTSLQLDDGNDPRLSTKVSSDAWTGYPFSGPDLSANGVAADWHVQIGFQSDNVAGDGSGEAPWVFKVYHRLILCGSREPA